MIEAIKLRREVAVAQAEEATNITVARIFEEIGRVGLCDPKGLFDEQGRILQADKGSAQERRAPTGQRAEPSTGRRKAPSRIARVLKIEFRA